jgi:ribosomal protein S12 methylthiotransferase
VVVNTCGFLEASKDESLGVIKEAIAAKESGSVKRVIVAGCLVQRHRAKMLEWAPGIDAMIGVFDRDRIVEAVRGPARGVGGTEGDSRVGEAGDQEVPKYWIAGNALQAARARGRDTVGLTVNGKDGRGIGYFEDDGARLRLTPRHYAYLRISEGCNQNCAFCTIPSIRGKMRSKPLDRIVGEARELVRDGAFELNLIGQDTTSYGDDIRNGHAAERHATQDMPGMLRAVSDAVKSEGGGGWVRLMYAYPSNFSDAMIDAFAELCAEGCVVPYIDMPLQHASDRVLEAMRRNVTSAQQGRVIRRLRERVPGMAVRTTFISGFPGETEDDHQRLLAFVEEMNFEALGVFEYSKEEGTPAGTMEGDAKLAVPPEVKARRRGEIMALQQKIVFARNEGMVGKKVDVLIDEATRSAGRATTGVGKGGKLYRGRTRAQAPMIDSVTFVQSREALAPGELVKCEVVGADGYDLVAKPVEEDGRVRLKVVR